MTDLTKLHRSELEALVVDMAKTQERFRQSISNIVREFEDEGDRVYLGSTNDADDLRDLDEELTETLNWLACKWMHGEDLWADLRELRKEKAEAAARIAALEAALRPFAFLDMGKDEDEGQQFTTQDVWETIYRDRVQDWISFEDLEAARAALEPKP